MKYLLNSLLSAGETPALPGLPGLELLWRAHSVNKVLKFDNVSLKYYERFVRGQRKANEP